MTARERMIATLEHRKPDRVPIRLGWRREVGDALRQYYAISFDCPIENVVAFFETARDFDLSSLHGPPEEIEYPPCMQVSVTANRQ